MLRKNTGPVSITSELFPAGRFATTLSLPMCQPREPSLR
jgi:hypothetical protein